MLRTRMRWLTAGVAVLAALAATLAGWSGIQTALADSNRPQEYLALGDSVAFGYSPLLNFGTAANFIGYPDTADATLKENLTNASCPGETSGHFIELTASDNGCGPYRHFYPLHVAYSGTQLAFADGFLQSHPNTLVVSINIGANDLFVLIRSCGGSTTPAEIKCIQAGLPAMLQTLGANLDIIYGHIRNADGYHHKLIGLTYYSLNYSDPVGTQITAAVNQVVADHTHAWGGIVADGFGAFATASASFGGDTCAAGLRIVLVASPLTCDVHPTPAGRDLLAQAIVNALRTD
jgi:lysophospholipase L1-like esterase